MASYLLGGLYILGSAIAWLLLALILLRIYVEGGRAYNRLPLIVGLWLLGMLAMEVSLLVCHNQWSLGSAQTIKSSIGWALNPVNTQNIKIVSKSLTQTQYAKQFLFAN